MPSMGAGEATQFRLFDRRADILVLAAIILAAGAIRIFYAFQPLDDAFSWRQASTAMIADNFRLGHWNILFPQVSWTGPGPSYQGREFQFYTFLVALADTAFGWHDWTGRVISCLFGMVTTFSIHRFTAAVWDSQHAHYAAIVYAIMPAAVMIDSSYLPDATMLACIATGLWLISISWKHQSRHPSLMVAGVTIFTLGALTKVTGLTAGAGIAYCFIVSIACRDWRGAASLLAAGLLVLSATGAYYAWAVHLGTSFPPYHVAGHGFLWDVGIHDFIRNDFYVDRFWRWATWGLYGYPLIGLFALGLYLHPSFGGTPSAHAATYVPLVILIAGIAMYLVAAKEITSNPWNLHILSLPIALFAGQGLFQFVHLPERVKAGSYQGARALLAVVLIAAWSTFPQLSNMKHRFAADSVLLGKGLAQHMAANDLAVTVAGDVGDPVAIYYSRRKGWVFPPLGSNFSWSVFLDDEAQAQEVLDGLRMQGAGWFGYVKRATDDYGRNFDEQHKSLIQYLNASAELVEDTDSYRIYKLPAPTRQDQ